MEGENEKIKRNVRSVNDRKTEQKRSNTKKGTGRNV